MVLTAVQKETFIKFKESYPTRGLPLAKRLYPKEFAEVNSHEWSRLVHELGYGRYGEKRTRTSTSGDTSGNRRKTEDGGGDSSTPTRTPMAGSSSATSDSMSLPDGVNADYCAVRNSKSVDDGDRPAAEFKQLKDQGVLKLITPKEVTATVFCEWEAMTEDQRRAYDKTDCCNKLPNSNTVDETEVIVEEEPAAADGLIAAAKERIVSAELCSDED
ncbi:hypothetical protein FOL47_001622 [Perkinsus chesapeaki]|uniref:Uncharacterized protein n=1 Tax=Perkinsus chesapeaki TaxID=330153 RepID=A0A7J6N1X5_PERCH|nr:hypothetical protein FOL47_001622 [Perkinsus chesapeaki]